MKLKDIFGKEHNLVIGVIHLPPLPGYKEWPGFDTARKNALADLKALIKGGVDGVIFENNYDIPHKEFIDPKAVSAMRTLGREIRRSTSRPVGVSVLWNDNVAALNLAKELKLQFVRIPVFVDRVRTDYGVIQGHPKAVTSFRSKISAKRVALFTDIHVKHSVLLSKMSLLQSARAAIRSGSDALILTGNWTGQAPDLAQLRSLRKGIGKFPILIGSGADKGNVRELLRYANGVIVSTSLKKGSSHRTEVNLKRYGQRLDARKTAALVRAAVV